MLLHFGFETPTPEIMAAWGAWFQSVAAHTVENAGLRAGRELTRDGTTDLAMGPDSITGYTILNAQNLDQATELARGNPYISSIRIYEIATH